MQTTDNIRIQAPECDSVNFQLKSMLSSPISSEQIYSSDQSICNLLIYTRIFRTRRTNTQLIINARTIAIGTISISGTAIRYCELFYCNWIGPERIFFCYETNVEFIPADSSSAKSQELSNKLKKMKNSAAIFSIAFCILWYLHTWLANRWLSSE